MLTCMRDTVPLAKKKLAKKKKKPLANQKRPCIRPPGKPCRERCVGDAWSPGDVNWAD